MPTRIRHDNHVRRALYDLPVSLSPHRHYRGKRRWITKQEHTRTTYAWYQRAANRNTRRRRDLCRTVVRVSWSGDLMPSSVSLPRAVVDDAISLGPSGSQGDVVRLNFFFPGPLIRVVGQQELFGRRSQSCLEWRPTTRYLRQLGFGEEKKKRGGGGWKNKRMRE